MKKFFKIVWKGLLGLAVASVALFGVVLGWAWYEDYTSYYNDAFLSDNVMVRHYYSQREYKVYNRQLDKITLKGLDRIVEAAKGDSLGVFFKQGKRGFLNVNTGRVVIPAQYRKAWVFSEGLAAVVNESGKIGFVNKDNQVVIPFRYDYRKEYPIDYLFHNGYCVMTDERGACGVIDKEGNWVMEPKYDCIWNLYFNKYRIVKEGEKYGMIDENLQFIFPVEYDMIEILTNEADGVMLTKGSVKQQTLFDGTIVNPYVIDGCSGLYYTKQIEPMMINYDEGSAYVKTEADVLSDFSVYWVGSNRGVMHRETGKVIIPAQYEDVSMVSPTLFEVELWHTESSILLDINGRRVEL